jgi:hypothetical protein
LFINVNKTIVGGGYGVEGGTYVLVNPKDVFHVVPYNRPWNQYFQILGNNILNQFFENVSRGPKFQTLCLINLFLLVSFTRNIFFVLKS